MPRISVRSSIVFAIVCTTAYLVTNTFLQKRSHESRAPILLRPPLEEDRDSRADEGGDGNDDLEENVAEAASETKDLDYYWRTNHEFDHLKKILYWNDAYGDPSFGFGIGHEVFLKAGCRVSSCYATANRTLFAPEDVDALIWHLRAKDKSLPKRRSSHTFYVFWMIESALYTYVDLSQYDQVFNWTFTYRTDSDFPKVYGRVRRLPPEGGQSAPARNYAAGKTKMAAWFVSNCNTVSDREILARTLQALIYVDVYGRCGPLSCQRSDDDTCFLMLEQNYKFYLAFENSLCVDYVTEKLYIVMKYNVVPVVYGLGYENLNLPPHSHINALNYSSVEALADYLHYLDINDTAYNEYFRWKSEYSVETEQGITAQLFCDMCERLHLADASKPSAHQQTSVSGYINRQSDGDKRYWANNSSLQYNGDDRRRKKMIRNEYRKTYDINQWFVEDKCIHPFGDNRRLAAYIHGTKESEIKREIINEEENFLPYLVRPNRDAQEH